MKVYEILIKDTCPTDWSTVPCAHIDTYRWLDDYAPKAWAQVVFVKDDGFYARMTCVESNPRAIYVDFYDHVYKDSCMEFFAAYDAQRDRYINIEINANAASRISIGEGRGERERIDHVIGKPFDIKAEKNEGSWSVLVHIPLTDICKAYDIAPSVFADGYRFRGNFYKCGDETEAPHFGMWNPVMTETPDFHRPEYFGELIIKSE